VHRAVQANTASSLGHIGQYPLYFVPAYQRLRLHSVRLLRDGELLERTKSAGIRFLQRETGLESAVYSGVVTAMLVYNVAVVAVLAHACQGRRRALAGTAPPRSAS